MSHVNCLPLRVRWAFNFRDWVPSLKEWELAVRCVQKEEKDKIYRYVYAQDAKASMIGRLMMRKASSEGLHIPYDKVCFSRTEHGKPYILNNESKNRNNLKYSFNISHHGDFCILAAEFGVEVGIDVMKIEYTGTKSVGEYFNLMKKPFSNEEFEFFTSPVSECEQLARFFRLWCLKESFVKAEGIGISYDLKSASFHCPTIFLKQDVITHDTFLELNGILASKWVFEETLLDNNHCVAVAVQHYDRGIPEKYTPVPFSILDFRDLMKNCTPFEKLDKDDWNIFSKKELKPH